MRTHAHTHTLPYLAPQPQGYSENSTRSDMWRYSATCKCKFSLLLHFSFDESFRTSVLDVGVLHLTPPPTISLSFSFLISWKNDKVNSMRTPDGVYSSSWLLSPFSLPSGAYLPWAYLALSVIIQEGSSLPMLSPCAPAYLMFDLGVVMCRNPNCHSQLLQCPTLCNPMGRSPPGSSVHGIFPARILERLTMHSSRESSPSRGWSCISYLGRQILYCSATREAPETQIMVD